MPPLSVKDVERFIPDHHGQDDPKALVALLATPGWRVRARFNAKMAALNLRFPDNRAISRVVLDLLEVLQPEGLDELVAKVETFRDVDAEDAQQPLPDDASDDDKAAHKAEADRRQEIVTAYDEVVNILRGAPDLDNLIAQRVEYQLSIPAVAASFVLIGWENGPGEFRRVNDVVPDSVLDLLEQRDLGAIGRHALDAMFVTKPQKAF